MVLKGERKGIIGGIWLVCNSTNRYGGEMGGIGFKKTLLCHGTEVMLVWIQVNLRDCMSIDSYPSVKPFHR
jgi:hypothetical protein